MSQPEIINNPKRWRRIYWSLLVLIIVVCTAGWYGYQRYQHHYPFGRSHCCDKQLQMALLQYANTRKGIFPAGENTPEASLSLLYRSNLRGVTANLLRGKTVPESTVQQILDSGRLLGPKTCGWYYVEGLTLADDPRLAIFWDKAGLGHNGQRLPQGGHTVFFVGGYHEFVPEREWEAFLDKQRKLHAARLPEH